MMDKKWILLTGVSRGLGLEIANTLLKAGYGIFGLSKKSSKLLEQLVEKYPESLEWQSIDLADIDGISENVFKKWIGDRPLYGFVNNAAVSYEALISHLEITSLVRMTAINQLAPMILVKGVIRNMLIHNTKGSIVHISSISANTGYKGLSMYAATKAAIEGFSKTTAREWGSKGIRSNAIAVGFMETDMTASMDDDTRTKVMMRNSLKRPVSLSCVADTALFLLSENSGSITGETIKVDNGS